MFNKEKPKMDDDVFKKQTVITSLKHMFKGSHFDICNIDKCLKVLNIDPPDSEILPLRSIHCVHWSEMEPKFKQEVFIRTLRLFIHQGFDLEQVDIIGILPNNGKTIYTLLKS